MVLKPLFDQRRQTIVSSTCPISTSPQKTDCGRARSQKTAPPRLSRFPESNWSQKSHKCPRHDNAIMNFLYFLRKRGKTCLIQPELPQDNSEILLGHMFVLKWCVTHRGREKNAYIHVHARTGAMRKSSGRASGVFWWRFHPKNTHVVRKCPQRQAQ